MQQKDEIINRLKRNLAEIITPEEFEQRINSGEQLTHYIGFEISGYVHIGQGIMSALVIKDLQQLGVKCTIWLADWHTAINHKLDGTKETAAKIGQGYFTEAMKACLLAVGADPEKVEFRLASEWYARDLEKYWDIVRRVMDNTTLPRMMRTISIMGKEEGVNVASSTLLYPAMQVADIIYQNIDIAHAGMDQRKVHVVMRDTVNDVTPNKPKPIAFHHSLLMGLDAVVETAVAVEVMENDRSITKRGELGSIKQISKNELQISLKMSKSKPDSAVFIHDSEDEIQRKIKKAFCQEKDTKYNPILNWAKHLLFWSRTSPFIIERKPEHGGKVEFTNYEDLEKAFAEGHVHPMDLKTAVAKEIIDLLTPAREHFTKPDVAAKKAELDKVLENK